MKIEEELLTDMLTHDGNLNLILAQFEKSVILQTMDNHWREHLAAMDHLRQGIHLRGYAQKDPKQEYKREAFTLFSSMLDSKTKPTFPAPPSFSANVSNLLVETPI